MYCRKQHKSCFFLTLHRFCLYLCTVWGSHCLLDIACQRGRKCWGVYFRFRSRSFTKVAAGLLDSILTCLPHFISYSIHYVQSEKGKTQLQLTCYTISSLEWNRTVTYQINYIPGQEMGGKGGEVNASSPKQGSKRFNSITKTIHFAHLGI